MDKQMLIEIFGYIGSALVVVSMLMSSIIKLRVINTIGSLISGTYALISGAMPLVLMNACLIVINVIRLVKLLKSKSDYETVAGTTDDSSIKYFMNHYGADIKKYFPDFESDKMSGRTAFSVFCGGTQAGLTAGIIENGVFDIDIDYSTPAYRDCSVAEFLVSELKKYGVEKITYSKALTDEHTAFLEKMGYKKEGGVYTLNV